MTWLKWSSLKAVSMIMGPVSITDKLLRNSTFVVATQLTGAIHRAVVNTPADEVRFCDAVLFALCQ